MVDFKLTGLISLWFKIIGINFMVAVTVHSDLEPTKKKKICHCFQFFPFCLPWSDRTRCRDLREEIRDDLFVLCHFSLPNGCTCYLDYMNFCDFFNKEKRRENWLHRKALQIWNTTDEEKLILV